ncbi:MAG: hypothetical protein J6R82_06265 [Clostridia bacterium]|nr:hypothetical protein [Clostridia bacterium]
MLKSIRKPLTVFLFLVLAISVLALSGCESALINNGLHRTECELYVNTLLNEDFEAAHAVTPVLSKEEHRPYFDEFCKSFEGATSYELTQTGWKINTIDGTTVKIAAYQIELDNGTTCQLTLQTTEGFEGITYINFNDSTAFIESTKNVGTVNIVLIAVSILLMAFPIWMLVDCAKRKISKKAWWIIAILLSLSLSFSSGPNTGNTSFMLTLLFEPWTIEAVVPTETITLTVVLPIGALIYFFRRKKLSTKYIAAMEAAAAAADPTVAPAPAPVTTAPATVADFTPAADAPVEQPAPSTQEGDTTTDTEAE